MMMKKSSFVREHEFSDACTRENDQISALLHIESLKCQRHAATG